MSRRVTNCKGTGRRRVIVLQNDGHDGLEKQNSYMEDCPGCVDCRPSKDAPQGSPRNVVEGINQDAPPVTPPSGGGPGPYKVGDVIEMNGMNVCLLTQAEEDAANAAHAAALQSVEPLVVAAGNLVAATEYLAGPGAQELKRTNMIAARSNLAVTLKDLSSEER